MKRVVMCSGKVYYDLLEQRRKNNQHDVAIVRIEQLYPFPHKAMQEVLQQFAQVKDFVWCHEEPLNQGAWYCSQHHFREVIPFGASLRYAGRPASASPAVGYMSVHQNVAIVRIEQLYPFPHKAMQEVLQQFAHVKDFVWCQEEPLNQGAWYCSLHHFRYVIPFGASLRYAGRPASASPAVGYMSVQQKQQKDLVNDALNVE